MTLRRPMTGNCTWPRWCDAESGPAERAAISPARSLCPTCPTCGGPARMPWPTGPGIHGRAARGRGISQPLMTLYLTRADRSRRCGARLRGRPDHRIKLLSRWCDDNSCLRRARFDKVRPVPGEDGPRLGLPLTCVHGRVHDRPRSNQSRRERCLSRLFLDPKSAQKTPA